MALQAKLPAPVIPDSISPFYQGDNESVFLTIPFSLGIVSGNEIFGFSIKIKTIKNNVTLGTISLGTSITINNQTIKFIENKYIYFNLKATASDIFNKLQIGSFLKIQLAYKDSNGEIGNYSNIGITKYTSYPGGIYIQELRDSLVFPFLGCTGVYELGQDTLEYPYSYKFVLYEAKLTNNVYKDTLIEKSDVLLHKTDSLDFYMFKTVPEENKIYRIQYIIKTINNLEVKSPLYECMVYKEEIDQNSGNVFQLITASNIFTEGYIELNLTPKSAYNSPFSFEICRSTDNFKTTWEILQRINLQRIDSHSIIIKDYAIEQGITYTYAYRFYNQSGLYSQFFKSNLVTADFEDIFLSDGKKQIKIRFNPKISSFKVNKLESKIDTIGSKYPFIVRNGITEYKEFPISGLISYHMDQNKNFMSNLDIIFNDQLERKGNPDSNNFVNQNIETTDLINYNIKAERQFKLELLNWLNNGETKLFKSPTEGNYLIKLTNVSLSPEDKVGRMLHNFSCTAYEIQDYNYDNLVDLNFYNMTQSQNSIATNLGKKTIRLEYMIFSGDVTDNKDSSYHTQATHFIFDKNNSTIRIANNTYTIKNNPFINIKSVIKKYAQINNVLEQDKRKDNFYIIENSSEKTAYFVNNNNNFVQTSTFIEDGGLRGYYTKFTGDTAPTWVTAEGVFIPPSVEFDLGTGLYLAFMKVS